MVNGFGVHGLLGLHVVNYKGSFEGPGEIICVIHGKVGMGSGGNLLAPKEILKNMHA